MSENNENQNISEETGISSIVNTSPASNNVKRFVAVLLIGLCIVALIFINMPKDKEEVQTNQQQTQLTNTLRTAPAIPELPAEPVEKVIEVKEETPSVIFTGEIAAPPPPPPVLLTYDEQEKVVTPEMRKMQGSMLLLSNNSSDNTMPVNNNNYELQAANEQDDLAAKLEATRLTGSSASKIYNRTFMITQGQFLDCVLETAIDSTVSGMVRARLSKNVYSSDGKMVLFERGTRMVGQYQRGIQQGEARLFVLWTRAETPKGVIININSPGADALGRAGLGGQIDYHFWQRFGSAIMFSMLNDVGAYLTGLANNSDTLTLDSTGDTATQTAGIALQNSINIPPTLYKNQGDTIQIYVARDLDFSGVYKIAKE